jgi:hypothetical protein
MDLVPGHIIVYRDTLSSHITYAQVWRTDFLTSNNQPDIIDLDDSPPLLSLVNPIESPYSPHLRVSAHECPRHEGYMYTIWACTSPDPTIHGTTVIHRYSLSLDPANPRLVVDTTGISFNQAHRALFTSGISYSGHSLVRAAPSDTQPRIVYWGERTSTKDDHRNFVDIPHSFNNVHVSAHGGAVTYSAGHHVIIDYYL